MNTPNNELPSEQTTPFKSATPYSETLLPGIEVQSDYEDYFFGLVSEWVITKSNSNAPFKNKRIIITAGPYRAAAVSYEVKGDTIHLDFYSALRNGFGSLSHQDVADIIELL